MKTPIEVSVTSTEDPYDILIVNNPYVVTDICRIWFDGEELIESDKVKLWTTDGKVWHTTLDLMDNEAFNTIDVYQEERWSYSRYVRKSEQQYIKELEASEVDT